eukprot:m.31698 g.31698  ORF g.31698 m.31698 type:complete len:644 (+) comp8339_c0_seq1:63-1994(+)
MFKIHLFSLLCCTVHLAASENKSDLKPHVVMMLVDDNGWAGVGYNNPFLNTPTIDTLAKGGLTLTSQYVYKYCAPTRGSFLTGRFPYKLAATRANFIPWTLPDGTHLSYAMLPKKLKAAGYYSVHIGKWHQGLYTPQYTPVGRGFDATFGFLEGGEDHNTSRTFGNYCRKNEVDLSFGYLAGGSPYPHQWSNCTWKSLPATALHNFFDANSTDITGYNPYDNRYDTEEGCKLLCENRIDCVGYSYRDQDPGQMHYRQCFLVSKVGGEGVKNPSFQSAICDRPTINTTIAAVGLNGTYTGTLFNQQAVKVIHSHAVTSPQQPFFMYYAMHDTHAPLEVPWRFMAPYAARFPNDTKRAIFSGMVSFVDEAVKNVTEALKSSGMWENTLYIFTTDNGSPVSVGGSNHPLRGGKGSNWEGGTRVPAFVTGGILPPSQIGKTHNGLIHICDWHATICALAGVNATAGEPHAVAPLDGVNAWPWISGTQQESNRVDMVYDHRMYVNYSDPKRTKPCYTVNKTDGPHCVSAAVQRNGWKLVVGPEPQNGWFGWFSPNVSDPVNKSSPVITDEDCYPMPCLFNLNASITEHEDVAAQNPAIVKTLLQWVDDLAYEYHPPMNNPAIDLDGYCAAINLNKGFVGPWMKEPNQN